MLSWKSNGSSDESRRTSLRRLSSIASFQNLFSRRRSHHVAGDAAASSSSNLSLSSSTATTNPPDSMGASASNLSQDQGSITELPSAPLPAHASNRRSTYICLPDDPIGGMPRSRTFSNLPLPTRAKRTTPAEQSKVQSKSHSRLPSALFSSTRIPSPPSTSRAHSHTRLLSAETKLPNPIRSRIKRSDTEPLLGMGKLQQPIGLPRSTAFKENISLSPIKPLPALDMEKHYSSSPPLASQYQPPGAWVSSSEVDVLSSSIPSPSSYSPPPPPPISKYASHPAIQMVRDYKSSPARPLYRSSKERPPTPGASSLNPVAREQPVQRWNSQPVFTSHHADHDNTARKDSSNHGEIKQNRLMSARQAPTPTPPKTSLSTQSTAARNKVMSTHKQGIAVHEDQTSECTPSKPPQNTSSVPAGLAAQHVTRYEPPAYWAGRLSALTDRYRNEELAAFMNQSSSAPSTAASTVSSISTSAKSLLSLSSTSSSSGETALTPKAQTDKMHTAEASTARLKKALDHLTSLCASQEARESLVAFQSQFAAVMKLPELKPPKMVVHLGDSGTTGDGKGKEEGGMGMSVSESRKASFMERLLGRGSGKRKSLVLT